MTRPWWLIWRVEHLAPEPRGGRTMVRLDKELRHRLAPLLERAARRFTDWVRP